MAITKRERVECALLGEVGDRLPYSFWTHFPGIDLQPQLIAAETARLVADLDLDFAKSMPNGLYCAEDWGVKADYSGITAGGVARIVEFGVKSADDWSSLRQLDVRQGAYGRELTHLQNVVALVGPDVPVLATVFSPLTIASKLAGPGYRALLATEPQLIKDALAQIAATVRAFAAEAIGLGCAGIFLASQESNHQSMPTAEYLEFGVPFDLQALEGASGGWFNVIHMHGEDVMFDSLKDYPVHALNWHIGETDPTLSAYRAAGGNKPVVGGMRRMSLTAGDYDGVVQDIDRAVEATAGRKLLLTPGCTIRYPVDRELLGRVGAYIKRGSA